MEQNRSHSKVDRLPPGLKKKVEEKLISGETYEDISGYLKEQGEDIHYSSIGRYGQKFLRRFDVVSF